MSRLYIKGIGMMTLLIIGVMAFSLCLTPFPKRVFLGDGSFGHLFVYCLSFAPMVWEVSFYTKGKHRFVGYVEMYLGKKAKFFSMLTTLGSYYFSLLIYAIMGGIFLPISPVCLTGRLFFSDLVVFAAGGLILV